MVARTGRNVTSHVHNLSCLKCFSSLFAIVLHDPCKLEVSREHLSMCCSDVSSFYRVRFMNIWLLSDKCIGWYTCWVHTCSLPPWRNTKRASVDTLQHSVLFCPRCGRSLLLSVLQRTPQEQVEEVWTISVFVSQLHNPYPGRGGRWGATSLQPNPPGATCARPPLNLAASGMPRCNLTAESAGVFAAS